jgi:putative transcriptional regulator
MASVNLTGQFLIAMPNMVDPNFAKTLTYVCEHNDNGALGLVVNRPTDMSLQTLLERINVPANAGDPAQTLAAVPVYFGGPVQTDRGFVLHKPVGNWQSTLSVGDAIGLTTSKDILEAVGSGQGPAGILVTLGYAGWAPGQLENELGQNAWLTVSAETDSMADVIFEKPAQERLPAAMRLLGIDLTSLSDSVGHA